MTRYLLLMRHSDHEWVGDKNGRARQLTKEGTAKAAAVGERLAEVLRAASGNLRLAAIRHAPSAEARATAEVVQACLDNEIDLQAHIDLSTDHLDLVRDAEMRQELIDDLLADAHHAPDGEQNAVLVVGHQPMLGWIAHSVTRAAYPVARAELLCLEVETCGRGTLRWVLSPRDEQVVQELRDKIKSKMDVAKLLSVFITAGLGFLLGSLVDQERLAILGEQLGFAYLSVALFLVAIGLYLATMYAYDSLLMPSRFWGEAPQNQDRRPAWIVARPPSSVQWILYQNMVRIWSRLFTPATLCVLAGLYFLAYAVIAAGAPWHLFECALSFIALVIVVVVVLAYRGAFRRYTGPWVGSED